MVTNLRVLHAHFSLERGGETVIWVEEQRRWPGRAKSTEGEHPFALRHAGMRAGLGKRLWELSQCPPPSPRVEMTEELQQALGWRHHYLVRTEGDASDNGRLLTLLLPSSNASPLPSPLLAQALDIELPSNAELCAWDVCGRAIGPQTLIALSDGVLRANGKRKPAPTLDCLAEMARLSIVLARSGALLPSSSGWELDKSILAKIAGRFQLPDALLSQYADMEGMETLIISCFARQFALGSLAEIRKSRGRVNHGSEPCEPWLQWLEGIIEFGLWPRNLTSVAAEYLVQEIEKARSSPRPPPLPESLAQAIDLWTSVLAPSPGQIRELSHFTIDLRTPEEGESWSLTVSRGDADEGEGVAAALEDLTECHMSGPQFSQGAQRAPD